MHPRNTYRNNPPDFAVLAEKYEFFREVVIEKDSGRYTIDFKSPESLLALTKTLLLHDFDLKLDIPASKLVPTVPLRLNYIHWLEDLLACLRSTDLSEAGVVRGIDIGTGSSCIYPLLGCRINKWNFLATEVDKVSIEWAQQNVQENGFDEFIEVKHVSSGSYLVEVLGDEPHTQYDFCMCNPPFFKDEFEALHGSSRTDARSLSSTVSTGTGQEIAVEGGEINFVSGIISDSLKLKDRVRIYTTMLGKKSSLAVIKAKLKEHESIKSITTTEFVQGKTMRWAIAWTFLPGLVLEKVNKSQHGQKKSKPLKFIFNIETTTDSSSTPETAVSRVESILQELKIELEKLNSGIEDYSIASFRGCVYENTWANQRKKRRDAKRKEKLQEACKKETESVPLQPDELHHLTANSSVKSQETFDGDDNVGSRIPGNTGNSNGAQESRKRKADSSSGDAPPAKLCHDNSGIATESNSTKDTDSKAEQLQASKEGLTPLFTFHLHVNQRDSSKCTKSGEDYEVVMEWVDGTDRNQMYQLFQYLQNKLVKKV